jgi:hypothetical protein
MLDGNVSGGDLAEVANTGTNASDEDMTATIAIMILSFLVTFILSCIPWHYVIARSHSCCSRFVPQPHVWVEPGPRSSIYKRGNTG